MGRSKIKLKFFRRVIWIKRPYMRKTWSWNKCCSRKRSIAPRRVYNICCAEHRIILATWDNHAFSLKIPWNFAAIEKLILNVSLLYCALYQTKVVKKSNLKRYGNSYKIVELHTGHKRMNFQHYIFHCLLVQIWKITTVYVEEMISKM